MVPIEAECENNNIIVFCESIEISNYDQSYLQLFMWNNGTRNVIKNIYRIFFVLVRYQIVTLTYDYIYSQLLMLKIVKGGLFMIFRSSFFVMINYTIITWLQNIYNWRSNSEYNYVKK